MPERQYLLALICASLLTAATASFAGDGEATPPSLERVAGDVWVHKSYRIVEPWGMVLSQGMVVKTGTGVILVDTAWDDADTEKLLDLIESEVGALPGIAIVTHAHHDKMGGMGALHRAGVETYAHYLSNEDAPLRGLSPAKTEMFRDSDFQILAPGDSHQQGDAEAEGLAVFYPGPGHARDNIVVYYPPAKILFGGCLIRPGASGNLGNTADGDIARWDDAVRAVAARFPEAEIVIPSHGPMGGRALLDHTIALAEKATADAQ